MRPMLEKLVKTGLKLVAMDRYHYLPPLYRMVICEAFGPTFQPATKKERQAYLLNGGQYEPTFGDLARNWLAILAAQQVVPLWREMLVEVPTLAYYLFEPNTPLVDQPLKDYTRTLEFPSYLLNLAQNILEGEIKVGEVGQDIDIAHEMMGNIGGDDPNEYPEEAQYVDLAALHALKETYGSRSYNLGDGYIGQNEVNHFNFMGNAAPASAAFLAYAGVYEEYSFTGRIDPAASLEFWDWWLTEAIPEAWELAEQTLKERG